MNALTLNKFNDLSDHEQYDLVFTEGQFIDYYLEDNRRFALYALYVFFIEIEYDIKENKIIGKISFNGGDRLNRYSDLSSIT